jgi:hypothetical protein
MIFVVRVDIMPVGVELPIEDQEQLFKEEEPQCLSKEGKWISSPAYSILSHATCIITKLGTYHVETNL